MNHESELQICPMLALRGLVLYPNMILHFEVAREKSIKALETAMKSYNQQIFLVAQKDLRDDDPDANQLFKVGVVARITQILRMPGNHLRVLVEGLYRAKMGDVLASNPFWLTEVERFDVRQPRAKDAELIEAWVRTVKEQFEEYCMLSPKIPQEIITQVITEHDPHALIERIVGNLPFDADTKQAMLEQSDPVKRLEMAAELFEQENSILVLENEIYDKVKEQIDKGQREYFLREQMRVISQELGEEDGEDAEFNEYYNKIEKLGLSEEAHDKLAKELDRLSKMPSSSPEANVIRNYLDTCLELPWNTYSKQKPDILKAQKILDRDHYGLQKVKERILEVIAVRRLNPDIRGQILCLVGPPGVGKTSIAKSVAKSLGRKYVRISLGGIKDESEIRGHRKTYIGAMPGRIINAMKLAGTKNPVILLDEIDKVGNDFRGDPASALLEVLDSEQNVAFRDHYIELPFDLSDVLFITTANDASTIPGPLYDRMDVIDLSSYTREEKFQIAKRHLWRKQTAKHGLSAKTVRISNDALYMLADSYTREAGVRSLERTIAKLCRMAAKRIVSGEDQKVSFTPKNLPDFLGPIKYKTETAGLTDEVGVVTGLAWTSVGGETMPVEVAVLEGSGKLQLTGNLGDVMKESAQAAVSYIRSRSHLFKIDKEFYKNKDIHIHVPEGAVPKDGPSAGITICTAIVSALTEIPVRHDVAMTGEVTLRGRVLPIGGLKEKTMAAYRYGIKTVLIPMDNEPDLAEVDQVVKDKIEFIPVDTMDKVLGTALRNIHKNIDESKPVLPVLLPETEKEPAALRIGN
nr:endopeptidase La [Candidatus Soleaferrea massiliensis]